MQDKQVARLLKKACWSSSGWKPELDLTDDELASLVESGYATPPLSMSHDECVTWALQVLENTSVDRVRDGFVWSMTSRQLEYRSALGSLAYLHLMPRHKFERAPQFHGDHCSVCGSAKTETITLKDSINFNFERQKWGGVRHDTLSFMAFDLDMFSRLPVVSPTEDDWLALKTILEAAADSETGRSVGSMKKVIRKTIKSNDAEADGLCHILSFAGILATDKHPGFFSEFTPFAQRDDLKPKGDQKYPLNCWQGPGYNKEATAHWFPDLDGR